MTREKIPGSVLVGFHEAYLAGWTKRTASRSRERNSSSRDLVGSGREGGGGIRFVMVSQGRTSLN